MSWVRAVADGFRPTPTAEIAANADVVAVHLPDWEQPAIWAYALAPYIAPGSLVVFAHGSALFAGAVDPGPDLDVVLVTGAGQSDGRERCCRIAVHSDATGHALERAATFARAAFATTKVGTTTLDSEVQADLRGLIAKYGGLPNVLAEWDRVLANLGHEPDEATLRYYERTRAEVLVVAARPPSTTTAANTSGTSESRLEPARAALAAAAQRGAA